MTSKISFYLLIFTLGVNVSGCDSFKKKGKDVAAKAKHLGVRQVDKMFPSYDSYEKDTENNKQRFRDHLQIALTNDVKNILAFGDFFGVDYKVLIAFSCADSTIKKIVKAKQMEITPKKDDDGLLFLDEFKWWDKDQIELLEPYRVGADGKYWEYLWYNSKTKQAFYEEFSCNS